MNILQYNILNGCHEDPQRLQRLGAWLAREAFDVVGLNELNGWDCAPDIAEKGQSWGYPYHALFVTRRSRHYVGALSRHPIQVVESIEDGCHHGILILLINEVHYLITHMTPQDSSVREREAARIASIAESVTSPLLVMGDLNTLSPLDSHDHKRMGLIDTLSSNSMLRRKFLNAEGQINYRPMQHLLDAGLVDLCGGTPGLATVPTASNVDAAHATCMRLDYILANQAFLASRAPVAEVLTADPLPHLSDHFPVTCRW